MQNNLSPKSGETRGGDQVTRRGDGPLGNTTRNRVPELMPQPNELASKSLETKKDAWLSELEEATRYYKGIVDRWTMQEIVKEILLDMDINPEEVKKMQEVFKRKGFFPLPRIAKCMRYPTKINEKVEIRKDPTNKLPHYSGLMV